MAEGILRKRLAELGRDDVEVKSAGVRAMAGMPSTLETIEVMKEEGVDVSGYRSKNLTSDMVKRADLILAMEPMHKEEILRLAPEAKDKVHLIKQYKHPVSIKNRFFNKHDPIFSVHDPIGSPVEEYRITRDEIKMEIERFVKDL